MLVDNKEGDLLLRGTYRVGQSLGRRSQTVTHRGRDLTAGDDVVIKSIAAAALPDNVRRRLACEADALGRLESPRISPLLELEQDGDRIYLISRYVEGVSLEQRLRQQGPLSADEALIVGHCLLEALQVAHDQGLLHRDIKPANVILTSGDGVWPAGATLVDFGLSSVDRLRGSVREVRPKTVAYLSPEQAGLLKQEVDERSDLYAAGVVLHEALSGEPPFTGESVGEVLLQHLNVVPPDLRGRGVQIPKALDDLLLHLLQKQPRDRYQTARAAALDLVTIQRELVRGEQEPALVVGLRDRRAVLTEPAFVGRTEELARLERALVGVRLGEGGLVLLEGEAGTGKTRLMDEVAQRAALREALVLRGQCHRARRHPFQLFEGLIDDLPRLATADQVARMRRELEVQRDDLCRVLPRLGALLGPGGRGASAGPDPHGPARTAVVLGALLDVLGAPERPAVVLFEDCQWSDQATRQALRTWTMGRPIGVQRHVLVIASCRPGAEGHGFQGEGLRPRLHIPLPPLADGEIQRMLRSMGGELPEAVVEALSRLARGNPLIATSALLGLVEAGELHGGPEGWRLSADALVRVQSSRRMASLLLERVQRLTGPLRELLVAAAILGPAFELDHVAGLAGQHPATATALLKEARRRHLIWGDVSGTRWSFVHDKLHQGLLQTVEPARQRQLHRRAAELLGEQGGVPGYEVAYHFDAAGVSERALPYAVEAARRARERYALEVAEAQYRIAERGLHAATTEQRLEVIEGLGEVLTLRDQPDEAAQMLGQALAMVAGDAPAQARIQGKIGQLAFSRGEHDRASRAIEEALRLLGRPVPAGRFGTTGSLVRELLGRSLHWARVRAGAEPRTRPDASEALALQLSTQLPAVYWFQQGPLKALWSHLYRLNLAERFPPCRELGVALAYHGRMLGELGFHGTGLQAARRSRAICEQIDDVWGRGNAMFTIGALLYSTSRFDEAIEQLEACLHLLERAGDNGQALIALGIIGIAHYRRGRLRRAQELGRHIMEQGRSLDHGYPLSAGLYLWGLASGGRVPEEQIVEGLAEAGGDPLRQLMVRQVEALSLLRQGRMARAAEVLDEVWTRAKREGFKREHAFPAICWRATALRLTAQRARGGERARLLAAARIAAREAVQIGRWHPNHLPHALRERGLLAAAQDRSGQARRDLEQSSTLADAQGARFERAQSELALGRIERGLTWPKGAERVARALDDLGQLGADHALGERLEPRSARVGDTRPVTVSLADRFDQVLRVGREIAGSLSREMVFAAVHEAALTLLRGERCLVLEVPSLIALAGNHEVTFSTTLVREALGQGRTVVTAGLPEAEGSESMVLTGIRSALAAPIYQRDTVRYVLYVTHQRVDGLFGDEEERLAGFITTLAGAALENADAFDALSEAHRDLKSTQGQLVQAGKLAALGQLGAGIAHELNQPIQSIQGFAQRIRRHGQALVFEHADELDIIINATHRMASIVQNIRLFARDDVFPLRPIDPLQPVQDALALLRRQLQEHGVEVLEVTPDEPLPAILGDPVKLQQVYLNLILNARDAVSQACPAKQIIIKTRRDAELVVVMVEDTGHGVAAQDVERIFDPFYTTKDAGQGTGLGLSISYGIVKEHGGELHYHDRVGGGAVFSVGLPAVRGDQKKTGRREPATG